MGVHDHLISYEKAHELFAIDASTGEIKWKVKKNKYSKELAGYFNPAGYLRIRVSGKAHMGHRVIWLMHYGEWPKKNIDHINGNPSDNRIENLRDVDTAANAWNQRKPQTGSEIPYLGVARMGKKYQAQIAVNRRMIYLGSYETPEMAHRAYLDAKRKYHPSAPVEE